MKPTKLKKHKYIFVVGGVMSGVGKGITTSSIGTILQAKGYVANIAKVDPYLNVDAGNMNPTEHGEVFVLNSGLETDQDMGNYERFLNRDLANADYMTSGMVYRDVIEKERSLGYRGKCVEAVPHIRDEIMRRINASVKANESDVTIVEIGGTVGDYQNVMFIEAARVFKITHPDDVLFVMVSYLPIPSKLGEMKSRPTQHAIQQLQSYGVQADFIIARSEVPIDHKRKEKIAISCNVPMDNVISAPDIDSIYDVPLNFERDKFGDMLEKSLKLKHRDIHLNEWKNFVNARKKAYADSKEVHIAVVGKYFDTGDFVLSDAYVSVIEALKFSSYAQGVKPILHWMSSRQFEVNAETGNELSEAEVTRKLKETFGGSYRTQDGKKVQIDGILVPGGFGETGIEGMISVIRHARENSIPYFGICYGMQLMVIEYARHVAGLAGAHTAEVDAKAPHVVIDIMEHQKKLLTEGKYGASMRLGGYPCLLKPGTIADVAYSKADWVKVINRKSRDSMKDLGAWIDKKIASREGGRDHVKAMINDSLEDKSRLIFERHRHRYEVNPAYVKQIADAGLVFSGTSPDGKLMEIAELPQPKGKSLKAGEHPFFLGVQFHPEFLARPLDPHPIFSAFIKASAK